MKLNVGDFLIKRTKVGIDIAVVQEYWTASGLYDLNAISSDGGGKYFIDGAECWELEEQGWSKLEF